MSEQVSKLPNPNFRQEVQALIDKEIVENQIRAGTIEILDERNETAILRVWRRAPKGPYIQELRSLVDKDDKGNLRCQIIQPRERLQSEAAQP